MQAPDAPQHAFNIQKEAVILVQAKNPLAASVTHEGTPAPGLKVADRPHYPPHLQEHFKGKRVAQTKFASLWPEMLNVSGSTQRNACMGMGS